MRIWRRNSGAWCWALLLAVFHSGCFFPGENAGPRPVMKGELAPEYSARYDSGTDELEVSMVWAVRFGKRVQSCRLADLDLDRAEIEAVEGGAFRDAVLVTVPGRGPGMVVIKGWGAAEDPETTFQDKAEDIRWADSLVFHCSGVEQAQDAVEDLTKIRERN